MRNPVRSSIVQDLRLLPIDFSPVVSRSPSIFLFLSVFLADKCVFQVMSINKSMSSNKKLLSLVKLVKLFVPCIQKCFPSKNFQRPPAPTCKAPPFTAGYAPEQECISPVLANGILLYASLDTKYGSRPIPVVAKVIFLSFILQQACKEWNLTCTTILMNLQDLVLSLCHRIIGHKRMHQCTDRGSQRLHKNVRSYYHLPQLLRRDDGGQRKTATPPNIFNLVASSSFMKKTLVDNASTEIPRIQYT